MSIYGYLNCHDCQQVLWLGKAIHDGHGHVHYFHIGPEHEPANWSREQLNQVVWKFLAEHSGHRIDVRVESDMTEEMYGYLDIGGDGENHITFDKYLESWRGIARH